MLAQHDKKKYPFNLVLFMVKLIKEVSCDNHDEIPHSAAILFGSVIGMGFSHRYL